MKANKVEISTTAKIEENGEVVQQIESGKRTFEYEEPTTVDESIGLIGEEATLDLITSEWRTRFANGARAKLRDLLAEGLDPDTAAEEIEKLFADWNPTVKLGGRGVDPETALRQKLASMDPQDAIAWLQEQQEALAAAAAAE